MAVRILLLNIFISAIGLFYLTGPVFFYNPDTVYSGSLFPLEQKAREDSITPTVTPVIPTFLGNNKRNFYGRNAPEKLDLIWKLYLGKGETVISRKIGSKIWAGAGWTGQALLIQEDGRLYLIQGAFDHRLKKIDAETGKIIWEYEFDDVVKGTGTFWENPDPVGLEDKYIILQGSRLGTSHFLDAKHVPSFRAISYLTGKELWRLDSKWTHSYSRDVDGSALIYNDTAYIGLENSLFTVFDPNPSKAKLKDGMLQPLIIQERKLYRMEDVETHKYNVVTECSPSMLDRSIFIASGSGRVWAYDLDSRELNWEFYIGSDIDGSPIVTSDSALMISVEKQYIAGQGGIYKLKPGKDETEAVLWYFPTENKKLISWEGGVIGSVAINDSYVGDDDVKLAAFSAIDGYLYVVDHQSVLTDSLVAGPDSISLFPTPQLLFKRKIGPSISTPIFTDSKLIAAGYDGIKLFAYNDNLEFTLLDQFSAPCETTPIVYDGKVFIASRDGYLYCLGEKK